MQPNDIRGAKILVIGGAGF
ncbi:hypothetical protein GW797_06405, partial [Candidatus Parcubacteria bacterium]|nr:hypothetical protein [Candidatus Parcubacteria bacterium]